MADRRMFAKTIIDSDAFLDMPVSTQVLYFHLSMRADDEGFINSPKKIQRMIGCSDDDMKLLIAKSFVILFETGIIVIKHWKIHNYIRKDRINETIYKEERSSLFEKSNGAYTLKNPDENGIAAPCQPSVNHMSVTCQPSDSIGKVRLGKDSIGKDNNVSACAREDNHEDDDLSSVVRFYTDNINSIPGSSEYQTLNDWLYQDGLEPDFVIACIKSTAEQGVKKMSYLRSIINACIQKGIRTKQTFDTAQAEFERRKTKAGGTPKNVGNFEQREYSADYFNSMFEDVSKYVKGEVNE